MSDVLDENTVVAGAPSAPAAEAAPQKQPKILKVYDREFDISTPDGFIQAQTWAEAMSTFVGKQSNEVGSLRKFKAERELPPSAGDFLAKVTELREMGDHRKADEMILNHARDQEVFATERLKAERDNDRLWDEYFTTRPDLTRFFPKETIRAVSESRLGIYDRDDPFSFLDTYWKPKTQTTGAVTGEFVPQRKPSQNDVPPVTLSGGAAPPPQAPAATNASSKDPMQEIDDILNAHTRKGRP
jgi:hypothetical protein